MFIVMGATGHVGQAVARALLQRGEAVTVVSARVSAWKKSWSRNPLPAA